MHQQHYFYKAFGLALTFILSLLQSVHAAPDIVAQNYAAANSSGVSSCTAGYDLMSGDVAYSKPQILGKLPFALNYRAPLRQNLSAAQSFAQPEQTSMGWTHNYQSYIIVQNISVSTATYRQYQANRVSNGYYDLTTFDPITTTNSAKEIIVRLPGESSDTLFKEQNGSFTRLYSADAIRDMNNYSMQSLPWSADLGEYSLSRSGGILTITKSGVSYTVTSDSYTISPSQSQTSTTNMYIGNDFNGYLTSQSWSINNVPNGAISDTAPYIQTTTTVSVALQRITSVAAQGQTTHLQYDANLNLTQVTDNFNNKLVFEHNYDDTSVGSSQTIDESRLITKVTYTSGSQANTQVAEFNYQSYATKVPSTGNNWTVFALISSNSTVSGSYTYNNEMTELGAMKAYIASKGRTADSSYYYPVLKQVINVSSKIEQQWDITQNYLLTGLTYSTASTAIKAYVGGILLSESTYDDVAKTITTTHQLGNGSPSTSSVQTTINSDQSITIGATGYPCLSSGGKPISSMEFSTARSRLTKTVDRNNTVFKYEYDNAARVKKITEAVDTALSRETTYEYGALSDDSANNYTVPTKITAPNLVLTQTINTRGQILQQTKSSPQAGSVAKTIDYTYYANGLLSTVNGPLAGDIDKISYAYDAYGNKSSESQVINGITRATQYLGYNLFGNPERIVSPNGLVTQFVYNADGTLKTQTLGTGGATGAIAGQTTSSTYNTLKQLLTETNPDGEVTSYAYDSLGRLIKTTNPDGSISTTSYYANQVIQAQEHWDSAGNTLYRANYNSIDSNGRISKTQEGVPSSYYWNTFVYDANGNLLQKKSALNITESWTYDALNRETSNTDGNSKTSTKSYDAIDNIISARDAINSGSQPLQYINGNVLSKEVNADFNTKSYTYNEADQLTSSLHNIRLCQNNNIDALGRISAVECKLSNGSTPNFSVAHNYQYSYDTSRFGRLDQVTTAMNRGVHTSYSYDSYDRVTSKTQINKAITEWGGSQATLKVTYGYSIGGKLTSMTLPSGRAINYAYDTANKGQLQSIKVANSPILSNLSYDGGGQLTSWNFGNTSATYLIGYDTAKNGVNNWIAYQNNTGSDVYRIHNHYYYDGKVSNSYLLNDVSYSYTYDNADHLTQEQRKTESATDYSISYNYDANGNRTSLTATGSHQQPAANVTYSYLNNSNRLNAVNRNGTIDTGNYLAEGELRFTNFIAGYDYVGQRSTSGRQNGISTAPEYYMYYNHKRERTVRSLQGNGQSWAANAIQYVYDESSHLIGEYTASGTPITEYIWLGDKPVAAIYGSGSSAKTYWIISDTNNTPRRLVDSSNEAIVWAWDSTAFGVAPPTIQTIKFNLRFPGQYYDELTKQHYNLNRYYNPELGRYMEPDPIGLEGGLNPYAYAGSNPVMNTDSTGLLLDTIPDIGLAGYSIYSAYNDPTWLNIGAAVLDSAAIFVPFVPAGAGLSVRTTTKVVEKIPTPFYKSNGGRKAADFITPHSTKHMYDPTKTTNATQFNKNVNVKALREDTMLNFDYASSDIFTQITKYEKKYDFNISTPNSPSGDMRIFINNPKPAASTNFPYYPRNRRK